MVELRACCAQSQLEPADCDERVRRALERPGRLDAFEAVLTTLF